jgi:hypothetical protein
MSAVMAATAVSGTAATIETAASSATAVGTSTAVPTITAASAIPTAPAAAERPLEAGARAAADTGRVAWLKFFAGSATGTRSTRFAGEKNFVFCRTGCHDLRGFAFELAVLFVMLAGVLVRFVFVMMFGFAVLVVFFVRRLVVFKLNVIAKSGDVQRVFVGRIGCGFCDSLRRA